MSEKFYLTTPIYYVNAAPHIGHTYTTFAADMIRTYKRMTGYDAVLTTGTDEHGQKVERAATRMGQVRTSRRRSDSPDHRQRRSSKASATVAETQSIDSRTPTLITAEASSFATGLIRFAGMMFPGKGSRTAVPLGRICSEEGSKICPAACDRSPSRSAPWRAACRPARRPTRGRPGW